MIEGGEGSFLIPGHALAPEPFTAAADIPVAQFIHKVCNGVGRLGNAVGGQIGIHPGNQGIQSGQDPLVHQAQLHLIQRMLQGIKAVNLGIHGEEGVGVPQSAQELPLTFHHSLLGEPLRQPRSRGGVEIPAESVCAELVQHLEGVYHIAQVLGHLVAFRILHVTHDNAVFKGCTVKEHGGNCLQGVEPATGLVNGFGNEVGREVLLELLLIFKGIVPLGEGHGAGIVPAVDNVRHTVHFSTALFAAKGYSVNVRTVKLNIRARILHGHLPQFLNGAYHMNVTAVALPHRQRRAPVPFTAQTPVNHILQEVAHPAFLDVIRHPVHGTVVAHQVIPHSGHLDVPGRTGIVQQGGIAAPAEGIIMGEGNGSKEQLPFFQVVQHHRVGLLHEHARPLGFRHHATLGVHQIDEGNTVLLADPVIVLTKGGGNVNNAGAVFHGNVVIRNDHPCLAAFRLHKAIQGLVGAAYQILALHFGKHGDFLALEDLLHQCLGHDEVFPFAGELAIHCSGIHAQCQVAGQGPGGGGPGQEGGILFIRAMEADNSRNFLHVLVALCHLVAAQCGTAAGAVGGNLMTQVEHALVINGLQAPPFTLDIVIMVGNIGVLHIHPVAYLIAHLFPLMEVLPHALLALADEGLNAVLLNLGLAVQTQQLFHFQLHRQAVSIPAGLSGDALALHGPEPGEQILNDPGFNVTDVRLAVGRRGAVKEGEVLAAAVPQLEGLADNVLILPLLGNFMLPLHKAYIGRYLVVHGCLPPCTLEEIERRVIKNRPAEKPAGTDSSSKEIRGTTQFGNFSNGNCPLIRPVTGAPGRPYRQCIGSPHSGVICAALPSCRTCTIPRLASGAGRTVPFPVKQIHYTRICRICKGGQRNFRSHIAIF